MRKLFAMEETSESKSSSNELLIDKLLKKNEQKPSPMSLTADLLKQREVVTKEVKETIENTEQDADKDKAEQQEDTSSTDEDTQQTDENANQQDEDRPAAKDEEVAEKTPEKKDDAAKPAQSDDDSDAADDAESLKGLIGSGLKDGSGGSKADQQPATESRRIELPRSSQPTLATMFEPLREHQAKYTLALESFGLEQQAVKLEAQPIAYAKDAVSKAIANLNAIAFKYIGNNQNFIDVHSKAILTLNERVTVLAGLIESKRYHLTHSLVSDRDVLEHVSIKGNSDPVETSRLLKAYMDESSAAISVLANAEFSALVDAFSSRDFKVDGADLVYARQLPGFVSIRVATAPYKTYMTTKVENFQYYRVKAFKMEDLYELPAISITNDSELEKVVKTMQELIVTATINVDSLTGVNKHFSDFSDRLKVIAYNVEHDQAKNLAELGIDELIKDFIKFKLIMECCLINISLVLEYLTSLSTVLDTCLELIE